FEHGVSLCHDHRDVGGHPGLQTEILIVDIDYDVIGHDILHIDRCETDLTDRTGKLISRVCIDRKGRLLPFGDAPDIRLADVGVDLHLRQIERDQKEVRCGKTGRDRLTNLYVSGDHDSVHRRANDRVLQV